MLIYWTSLGAGALTVLLFDELGHLLAARWSSVRVLSISVGLGPELIGFSDRFGTRWRIGPLPIGGYVAMQDKKKADDEIDDFVIAAVRGGFNSREGSHLFGGASIQSFAWSWPIRNYIYIDWLCAFA